MQILTILRSPFIVIVLRCRSRHLACLGYCFDQDWHLKTLQQTKSQSWSVAVFLDVICMVLNSNILLTKYQRIPKTRNAKHLESGPQSVWFAGQALYGQESNLVSFLEILWSHVTQRFFRHENGAQLPQLPSVPFVMGGAKVMQRARAGWKGPIASRAWGPFR